MNQLKTLKLVLDHDVMYVDISRFVDGLPHCHCHIFRPQHLVPRLQQVPGLAQAELPHDVPLLLIGQGGLEALGVYKPRENIHQTNSRTLELLPGNNYLLCQCLLS